MKSEIISAANVAIHTLSSSVTQHKLTSFIFGGAVVSAGALTVVNAQAQTVPTNNAPAIGASLQSTQNSTSSADSKASGASSQTIPKNTSSVQSNVSSSSTGQADVQVTVNGQNVPVPANGMTQQTVPTVDGSQTTVTATGSNQGTALNKNVTSLDVTVTNRSTVDGGPAM